MDIITKTRIKRFLTTSRGSKIIAAVAVLIALGAGYLVLQTGAISFFAAVKPSSGSIGGNARVVNDSGASGGVAVEFGAGGGSPSPSPPPDSSWGLDFSSNPTHQKSSVSQYGITWQFDRSYTTGQYANGDWWVVGPVKLTNITPESTSTQHGENINPKRNENHYDSELGTPVHQLGFPVTVQPGSSIVKGVSRPDGYGDSRHRGKLKTAGVLTVVSAPPPKNGATVFRPPYFESEKPQYLTTSLRTDMLPSLPSPSGSATSLASVASSMSRLHLDHSTGNEGNRYLHPVDNLPAYGSDLAQVTYSAALRLMLNDSLGAKSQALINYAQYGIDLSTMFKHDAAICSSSNPSCAGHGMGRTLPLVFAATMLDSQTIKNIINNKQNRLPDNWSIYNGNAPTPLFGETKCSESRYFIVVGGGAGSNTCRDPFGHIDGGKVPGSYLNCCMVSSWKAAATAMHLMPQLKNNWPQSNKLLTFIDRWVDFGLWALPDPNSSQRSGFGAYHGTGADGGGYNVELTDALWNAHNLSAKISTNWSGL